MAGRYPGAMRALHWLMALIVLGMIAVGWYMADLPKDAPNKLTFYPWHKSFGVLVFLLVWLRLAVRWRGPVPPLPATHSLWEKRLARINHGLFYVLLIATPAAGYTMSVAAGHAVHFFGLELPSIVPQSKALAHQAHELHELFAFTLLGLIGVHVLAVIKHQVVDAARQGDVLRRML